MLSDTFIFPYYYCNSTSTTTATTKIRIIIINIIDKHTLNYRANFNPSFERKWTLLLRSLIHFPKASDNIGLLFWSPLDTSLCWRVWRRDGIEIEKGKLSTAINSVCDTASAMESSWIINSRRLHGFSNALFNKTPVVIHEWPDSVEGTITVGGFWRRAPHDPQLPSSSWSVKSVTREWNLRKSHRFAMLRNCLKSLFQSDGLS